MPKQHLLELRLLSAHLAQRPYTKSALRVQACLGRLRMRVCCLAQLAQALHG
jgi:hypothetical protein